MSPERFAALAVAFGSNLERWPVAEREAARAHLRYVPDAVSILEAEAGLDAALLRWSVPGPGAALAAQIAALAERQRSRQRRLRLWLSGLGAAASLAGGVTVGLILVPLPGRDREPGPSSLYDTQVLGFPLDAGILGSEPDR